MKPFHAPFLLWTVLTLAEADELQGDRGANREPVVEQPAQAQLKEERATRIELARERFEQIKNDATEMKGQGSQLGNLLAPVVVEDSYLVAEVLDAWLPTAEADPSGEEMAAFVSNLLGGRRPLDVEGAMGLLHLVDFIWKGNPPPISGRYGDPMKQLWRSLPPKSLENPELWRQTQSQPPKVQARFWAASRDMGGPGFCENQELCESLREAAQNGEITRAAFAWHHHYAMLNRSLGINFDANTLLEFPRILKAAGLPAENLAPFLGSAYTFFGNFDNRQLLITETSVLLDGIKTLPRGLGDDIIMVLSSIPEFDSMDESEIPRSASPSYTPGTIPSLLRWVIHHVGESSLSGISCSQLSPKIIASGDDELLDQWLKALGPSAGGNVQLISCLLEKNRIAEAVALNPLPGRGWDAYARFTSRLEQLVATKLRNEPSTGAFRLAVGLSLLDDAAPPEAPAENKAERRQRLATEFERIHERFSAEEYAAMERSLGTPNKAAREGGLAARHENKAFRDMLSNGKPSEVARAYCIRQCRLAIAGDLSGIKAITDAIESTPIGAIADGMIEAEVLGPVAGCFTAIAKDFQLPPPKATVEVILGFSKALTDRQSMRLRGVASRFVHLAAADSASLVTGLKQCGLEGVKPTVPGAFEGSIPMSAEAISNEIRIALLRPFLSKPLLASLDAVTLSDDRSPIAPLLNDPKLRAAMSPEVFVRWSHEVRLTSPEELESMKRYVQERAGEFSGEERIMSQDIIERLVNPAR